MKLRGAVLATVVAVASLVPGAVAHAVISGTSGQVTKISPPASVAHPGTLDSDTTTYAWDEKQGESLASPVSVDIATPGVYTTIGSTSPVTLPLGTVVDSHFFNSARIPPHTGALTGTLTFPTDILGIIVRPLKLKSTNDLGVGTDYTPAGLTTIYPFELDGTGDTISMPNLRTVTLTASSSNGGDIDELRILTKHDRSPVANAGGPYAGVEGGSVTLSGTATDPESELLTTNWSFAVTSASPGTVCTPTNTNTLTPTISCNDNAVVTASMSVKDPYNPAVVSSAVVTIGNVAPALAPLVASAVGTSTPATVHSTFTDVGTNDTHTATIDWGDTTTSAGTIVETNGSGTVDGSHSYATGGNYTITVTLYDDDGGTSVRSTVVGVNGAPTANAGGPYSGTEGSAIGLTGTASDPENNPLATNWTFTPTGADPGTVCTPTNANTLTPTISCNDDALVNAHLSVSDNINTPTVANATVAVINAPPTLSPLTVPAAPVAVGANASIAATFTDPGTNDTHTASVNWGDFATSNAAVTEAGGAGSLTAAHAYALPGLYTVTVTLTDDNGGTSVRSAQILVNSPPVVSAGGPYFGFEGSTMVLTGASATDVDGDNLTYTWAFTYTGDPGVVCNATGAGVHALALSLVCNDDAVVTATLTVSDGVNAPVQSAPTTLTVGNVSPVVTPIVQAPSAPPGATVAISSTFTDAGTNDTHTATINWGDGNTTAGNVSELGGAGSVNGSHLYAVDGVYPVTLTVTDDNGGPRTVTASVISDTTAPVITPTVSPTPNGAGWNNSVATITWTVTDSLSPITAMTGCDPTNLSSDTAGTTYTCTATSRGGTASRSVTVKLDQVAPLLSGAPTTPPNGNGWYNAPVTIHWTCSDALSGIAGTCPANTTLSSEGTAVTASASVADVADNVTNSTSAPVQIDTHAPHTTASAVPTWNNGDVVLTLSPTDNLSGIDSTNYIVDGGPTQSGTSVLLTTAGIHTVKFWSVDVAGNVEPMNTATVRIDKTAPTITSAQSPIANVSGWNNTNVTVTFACNDLLSGVAGCTGPQSVTSEGANQAVTGNASDNAGNTASTTRTLNIDKTPPTITGTIPPANGNGWYNAPVTATFACADALSGVATCPSPSTLSSDGAGQSISGTATDTADNAASTAFSGINIDQAPPTIVAAIVPAANASGWNNGPVTVHFTCTDATSGIASGACPADQSVSAEGITTVAGTVSDRADNTASTSIVVRIDTIAPGIAGSQTPDPNGAGWNNTDVTVSFVCTDAGSGIAFSGCSAPAVVGEGAGQAVTGTALDTAGNSATTTVSGINVDKTAPTLSGAPTTAPNADGWYSGPVTIHWTCADALSGIAGSCPADSVINSEGVSETATASVNDVAGNTTSAISTAVNIDRTAPATAISPIPDWSNATVNLTLTATDNLSGVASTNYRVDGGAPQVGTSVAITSQGVHTVDFWSVDHAGNVEATHTSVVKIDATAPTITASAAPPPNGAGWNNSDVTVTFICSDSLSGIASCTPAQLVTTEGAGQSVTGDAVDNAGNTAAATATLNIDKTPPTIHGAMPPANAFGWYNAPVTVNWTCGDALSGVASCPNPPSLSVDGAAQSTTGTASDTAGNSTSATVSGINIDQVAPTITPSAPATTSGWYTGPVTVHWTCADSLSGVVTCPGDQTVSAEGVTTLAQTISDKAGNSTTNTITIRIDKTPPTIVGNAAPAANANGWNNSNVTVSFTCADSLSGTTLCSGPSTLGEGAHQSVTGTAADLAGNTATATVSGINVDKTAPTLSGAPTTSPNANGWYKTAVTIHWTCADALSGVDGATCPGNSIMSGEGAGQTQARTVLDLAGNATSATSSPAVNVDLSPPLTSAAAVPSGPSSVTVALTAIDNLSGVDKTNYSVDGGPNQVGTSVTINTVGTHTLTYYSVDKAGNVEGTHVATVKITANAPTITAALSPTPNAAGWNKSNVTVTFTCVDAVSGIASCTPPQTVSTEGAGQQVTGTAVNNAGVSALKVATVNLDKTPPTITGALSGSPNSYGWFNAPVTASFTCGDSLSGVALCTAPVTIGQGASQSVTGTAVDIAGNTATKTLGPVNVDLTKPTITATATGSLHNGVYAGPVTIHFTCTDALSGIVPTTGCPADQVVSSSGTTTVSGTATDKAGNTMTTSITVTVKKVCEQEQDTLVQVSSYRSHASWSDAQRLRHVEDVLGDFGDPSRCHGDNHVDHDHGGRCFGDQLDAVQSLSNLRGIQSVPASTIDGWIDTLANSTRVIAGTALDDANSAHGSAYWIARAQSDLAAGDASKAANDNIGAIGHYQNAWQYAQNA